ncbi:MAG: ATP-binding protein [Candidatus Peribacteraceae bacterium]
MEQIFISSVQKEFRDERRALKDYILGDPLLRRFFKVFLFEDLPASDRRADNVYLDEVERCDIYVGLFGNEYGYDDAEGLSPTEREFDRASVKGKTRLIFVKGAEDSGRHPKMLSLIRKAGVQLIRRRFSGSPDLLSDLYASLVEHLERRGLLRTRPFDASACQDATIADISKEKVKWFVGQARQERQYILDENTPPADVLTHLNLFEGDRPTHAALLLFGRDPQRFLVTSEVKCMHFHGTEIRKPIPSYQIYKGTVFDLVDQAVDFVMSKISRSVGTRAQSSQAPVEYELPRDAVAEAIINAVVHRDYTSNASVQVMLFSDRLEVWNPGELPPPLTVERLRLPHASIPRNPLICEPMFLTRYAEKAGSGILDMIALCKEAGLPDPEFRQDGGQFVQTIWRDWLTNERMGELGLNKRQKDAVEFVRKYRRIFTKNYMELAGITDRTALRDLDVLVAKGVFEKVGVTGRTTHYVISKETRHKPDKPDIKTRKKETRHKPDKPDKRDTRQAKKASSRRARGRK